MMYLTPNEAETRLNGRYSITADLTIGDLMIASDALDAMAPFEGVDLEAGPIPDALLDYVALKAHALTLDHNEGMVRGGISGAVSGEWAWPQLSPNARRLEALLSPYVKRTGTRV